MFTSHPEKVLFSYGIYQPVYEEMNKNSPPLPSNESGVRGEIDIVAMSDQQCEDGVRIIE